MTAFMNKLPQYGYICPSCGQHPCMDGTGCIGNRRSAGDIIVTIGAGYGPSLRPSSEPVIFRTRDQRAPRSPQQSFKKSSKR